MSRSRFKYNECTHCKYIYYAYIFLKFKLYSKILRRGVIGGALHGCIFRWFSNIKVCLRSLFRKIYSSLFDNAITVSGRRRFPLQFFRTSAKITIATQYLVSRRSFARFHRFQYLSNGAVCFFQNISSPSIPSMKPCNRFIFCPRIYVYNSTKNGQNLPCRV